MTKRSALLLVMSALVAGWVGAQVSCNGQNLGDGLDGGGDGGDLPPVSGLLSISVTPPSATLNVDNVGAPQTQAYQAIGHFDGKPDSDVTNLINWRIDNTAIGNIGRGGVFTTSNQAGGQGVITAYSGDISATAQILINFQPVIKSSTAPADAATKLPATATGTVMAPNSPTILYPSGNTMFPRNIFKVRFEWTAGTGNNLYRLEFKSAQLTMSVYTTATNWTPDQTQWGYIASSNAGSKATWTVYATNTATPNNVYRSSAIDLNFSKSPVDGAIYYWSTTVAGVRRATVSDAAPVDFLTPAQIGKCVACHTVSRNGARVGADIGGNTLGVYNVKDRSVVIDPAAGIAMAWTTFSPDNSRIVTASKGVLTLRSGDTGAVINTLPLAPKFGTMPDWSPDGRLVAFAYSTVNKDRGIAGSAIATMEYSNGTWTNLKTIVPSTGNADSKYYPSFSPDSKWIAYVSAAGGNSDNNDAAKLFIVAADGGTPVELAQVNRIVNNADLGATAPLADTMPTWAPTKPGETMFVAFTSARAYATVYASGKYKQMWVAGVDPNKLPGQDPSFPAFRLPFQGDTENSHRPFWAEDVLAPPTPPDGGTPMCIPTIGTDCSTSTCCSPNYCSSTGGGPPYTCQAQIG